ncbi:CBS domain-containing protein [Nakamurella endophytica]|uniref:CBS domain-containing protein n=1 Tax=Nakamurella endophytica TaxID=1748367 RepID=A0A917WC17_9ACTN|nr:CBS domain-containing protein [Nakamurella endophytica]GGL90128.1 hypothetical protein GCM10011594_07260 [Nakamurella endophytica]
MPGEPADQLPVVTARTPLRDVALLLVRDGLPGVVVTDADGGPVAVVTALDLLGRLVPEFVREDPALARVYDAVGSAESWRELGARTIAEIFGDGDDWHRAIAAVDDDATAIEVAAEMLNHHTSVAVVRPATAPGGPAAAPRLVTVQTVIRGVLTAKGEWPPPAT